MDRHDIRVECARIALAHAGRDAWRALALEIEEFVLAVPGREGEGDSDEFFSD